VWLAHSGSWVGQDRLFRLCRMGLWCYQHDHAGPCIVSRHARGHPGRKTRRSAYFCSVASPPAKSTPYLVVKGYTVRNPTPAFNHFCRQRTLTHLVKPHHVLTKSEAACVCEPRCLGAGIITTAATSFRSAIHHLFANHLRPTCPLQASGNPTTTPAEHSLKSLCTRLGQA
jgi:hypothetical protein